MCHEDACKPDISKQTGLKTFWHLLSKKALTYLLSRNQNTLCTYSGLDIIKRWIEQSVIFFHIWNTKYVLCIAIYCVVCAPVSVDSVSVNLQTLRFNDAGVKKIVFSDNLANAEGRKKDSKTVVNSHVGLFACN